MTRWRDSETPEANRTDVTDAHKEKEKRSKKERET